jgi:hypothetical protein
VHEIETGCEAINSAGMRRGIPGDDHGDDHVRLKRRMLWASFVNLAIAIPEGAHPTRFGKPFVRRAG